MLKRVVVISLICLAVIFSPFALAVSGNALKIDEISNNLTVLAQNDVSSSMQKLRDHNGDEGVNQGMNEDIVSSGTAGWLFGLVLVGFVALSNRRMV